MLARLNVREESAIVYAEIYVAIRAIEAGNASALVNRHE
jgi:hypothetical protein